MNQIAAIPQTHTATGAIRRALELGRLEDARRLLGSIESIVEHGDARGRTMGFPTANMHLEDGYPLAFGIYAVRVAVLRNGLIESRNGGVANFGVRPMYRITRPLLEAHLFDFAGDLYGLTLRVEFVTFLRPEASFPNLDALIAQIEKDARKARAGTRSDSPSLYPGLHKVVEMKYVLRFRLRPASASSETIQLHLIQLRSESSTH